MSARDPMTGRLRVASTWNGLSLPDDEHAVVTVTPGRAGLDVAIVAPFWGDPAPVPPPGHCPRLWEHEVVELFVGARGSRGYTELELGPHGHWLLLRLVDVRSVAGEGRTDGLRVDLDDGDSAGPEPQPPRRRWRATATVPWEALPSREPASLVGNAYAIHGQGDARRYLAAHPVPGARPDFHQPASFRPLFDADAGS